MGIQLLTLNDGNTIPQLGYGVWQLPADSAVENVLTAIEAGYRQIDTAPDYRNEASVGEAVRQSGIPREEIFITTKLDNSEQGMPREGLERSLLRLGLDYVDLYLIHWPVPARDTRFSAWEAMQRAQSDGLIRSIGVSNFSQRFLQEFLDRNRVVPAINQIECHPLYQQAELQALNSAHGIVTAGWSPLGMGRALRNATVQGIANRHEVTPAQVVLRWHMQSGRVVIPKSATPERTRENIAITGFELDAEEIQAINSLETGQYFGWDPEHVN